MTDSVNRTIKCPAIWQEPDVFPFLEKLVDLADCEHVLIDLSGIKFVKPFGTLLMADGIKRFAVDRKSKKLKTNVSAQRPTGVSSASSYLRHVGFYQYIGVGMGNQPGEAISSSRYAPITYIEKQELHQISRGRPIQEAILAQSDQLAEILLPHITEQLVVSYCLREIIRNVFEHASVEHCVVMAQRYSDGPAEICILDKGIGIDCSLSSRFEIDNVDHALNMAIQPGISRESNFQTNNRWGNSGYGLYILSEIGAIWGDFWLVSNGRFLRKHTTDETNLFGEVTFSGTALKLSLDLSDAQFFPNLLSNIIERGEKQQSSEGYEPRKASASSRLLSPDKALSN